MIHNIIFDMGNVLVLYDPEITMTGMGMPREDMDILLKEAFGGFEWAELDRGTMTPDEAFETMKQRLPKHLADFIYENAIRQSWMNLMPPFPKMEELVKQLKAAGYGVYLLSNATPYFYDFSKNYPVMELMDGKIISSDYKLLKPEPEIYKALFEKFSLAPEECFFVDDMQRNIDGAKAVGMDGICFSPAHMPVEHLIDTLRNKGVNIAF